MRFSIVHLAPPVLLCALTTACSGESPYTAPDEPKAEPTAQITSALQTFPLWGMICQGSNPVGLPCMRYMGNHNEIMGIDPSGTIDQMFQYDGTHIRTWDGHCLDDFAFGLTGSPINAWECNGKANQNWSQDGANFEGQYGNGRFHGWGGECLENVHRTGIDLAINGAQGSFQMQPCDTGQAWQFFDSPTLPGNGGFQVPVTLTGNGQSIPSEDTYPGLQAYYPANIDLTLDVQWNGRANGTTVWLWTHNGGTGQQWNYNSSNQTLSLTDGSNMCLDKPAGQNANGTLVQLRQCTGAANQQWQRVDNPGYVGYQLVNVESGRCLDASFGNFNAGAAVGTWDCTGGINQQWRLFFPFPPNETLR